MILKMIELLFGTLVIFMARFSPLAMITDERAVIALSFRLIKAREEFLAMLEEYNKKHSNKEKAH